MYTAAKSRLKQYKWSLLSVVLLFLVIAWITSTPEQEDLEAQQPVSLLPVTFARFTADTQQLTLSVSGLTQPRWPTHLTAAVGGRLATLNIQVEPGALVNKGQVLAEISPAAYQANVDAAASRLADAQLNLERNLHEQTVAKTSGGNIKSPFGRYEPQVAAANQAVKAAQSALVEAKQRLNDTQITAPFDAIVLKRFVTPAQWIQPGEQLFQLAAQSSIDIKVELSEKEWRKLSLNNDMQGTTILSIDEKWPANVRYISPVRDPNTRQRSLVLKVDDPYRPQNSNQALLPDTQVSVIFSGNFENHVFICPSSALTEDGAIWTIDENNQLNLEEIELLEQTASKVTVRFKIDPAQTRNVVLYPLGSMLEGQTISPIEVDTQKALATSDVL